MSEAAIVRVTDADIGYPGTPVLKAVTCSIARGAIVGLVGPNGAGKTTFLRSILGHPQPSRGRIEVESSLRFAYVPQADQLSAFWPLSVREMVALPTRARRAFGIMARLDAERIEEAIASAGLADIAGRRVTELSGGQRQRAVLAQAISQKPDVLLLDEPTRGLDVSAERDLLALIGSLRTREGWTVLLVTHTLNIPINFADSILLFQAGAVVQTTPKELIETRKLEETYGRPFIHLEHEGVRWVAAKE